VRLHDSGGRGLVLVTAVLALGCDSTLVVGADPSGTPGPPSLVQGLVLYWKLDDGPGVARALDSSGHADDALPEAVSATDWIAGRFRGALLFGNAGWLRGTSMDGANAITAALSISMWIRLRDHEDREQVILQRQVGTGADAHFLLSLRLGRPALGGVTVARCEGPALDVARWQHLAVTADGASIRLFFDGQEVASCAGAGAFDADATVVTVGGGQIGASPFQVDRRLRADLDEIALWNRTLTADELRALAAGQLPPAP
jgi:hypothetical protein